MKWGYKRAFARCALLFAAGTALQLICGNINPCWFRYPLGLILALNYLYILILLTARSDRWTWVRQLTDHHAGISSLTGMLAMTLLFGLIRQDSSSSGLWGALGFRSMSTSWPFCLMLLYFMTVLGMRAFKEIRDWRSHPVLTIVIHTAVFVGISAAFFGSGDKVKARVVTKADEPSHIGISPQTGRTVVLPFVICLEEFVMEEYPNGEPKMFLSRIKVSDKKREKEMDIRVNHPGRMGSWKIYQVGYDKQHGTSTLECVKDGWYPMVKTGLWIILSAGVFMALTAGMKRKREEKR